MQLRERRLGGSAADLRGRRGLQLYETALDVFRARGYEAATIADITEAAGVSRRTFFNYFPSKESVLARLHRDVTLDALDELVHMEGGPDLVSDLVSDLARLRASLMRFGQALEGERVLVRGLVQVVFSSPVVREQDAADVASYGPELVRCIQRAQKAGALRADPHAHAMAGHLMAVVSGALTHWALRDSVPAGTLSELLSLRLDLAFGGIATRRTRRWP